MNAWDIFYANAVKNSLVKNGDKILLAVSGGKDSVCMLHLFWRLSKKMDLELLVANFDHGLRAESARETLLVSKLCGKLGLRCISRKIAAKEYSLKHSVSLETAGRILRYANLEDIAHEFKCNKIATAHNANDNAETVLMWLLRGSGSFAGIPQKRQITNWVSLKTPAPPCHSCESGNPRLPLSSNKFKDTMDSRFRGNDKLGFLERPNYKLQITNQRPIEIIRPLLPVNRKKIEEYIKRQKLPNGQRLPFCTDKSNFSREYTRNRIRLGIIPQLEKINPMAVEHIFSLSEIQAREDAYLEEISITFAKKCAKITKNRILLDLTTFLRYNEAVRYRVLKYLFPDKKYAVRINAVMDKIVSAEKSEYALSSQWIFRISKGKAVFERQRKYKK
ncbi:MAG: tRNA lysidine(34) synthetase TilS [Endomicrobia bacterium]|nr:tRNA lysidine(34) synthetase TilS [Endomicrobiia bacterium]